MNARILIPTILVALSATVASTSHGISAGSHSRLSLRLGLTKLLEREHKAAFEQSWSRYPAPDMIVAQLRLQFPLVTRVPNRYVLQNCMALTPENRSTLGDNNASSGKPLIDNPNSAFAAWHSNCLKELLKAEANVLGNLVTENPSTDEDRKAYFGEELYGACTNGKGTLATDPARFSIYTECGLATVPREALLTRITELVEELIGPSDVIKDLGLEVSSSQELAQLILEEIEAAQQANDGRYDFLRSVNDRPYTLMNVMQIAKFLTLITDTMKY